MSRVINDSISVSAAAIMTRGSLIAFTPAVLAAIVAGESIDPNIFCSFGSNVPGDPFGSLVVEVPSVPHGLMGAFYQAGIPLAEAGTALSAYPYSTAVLPGGSSPYIPTPGVASVDTRWLWDSNTASIVLGQIEPYSDLIPGGPSSILQVPYGLSLAVVQVIDWTDDDIAPFTTTINASGDRSWITTPSNYFVAGSITLRGRESHIYGAAYPVDFGPRETFVRINVLCEIP